MTSKDETILPNRGDNIIRTKERSATVNPKGIADELYTCMKRHSDKIGQIEADTGKQETFGVILERSVRVACHLRKLGVTSEDIITPCTTNHVNTAVIFHATIFIGAKPACMDPFAPKEDAVRQLQLVKPKFLFAIPENVNVLEMMIQELNLNTKIVVFGNTTKHISFDHFLVPLPNDEQNFTPYIVADINEIAFIVFSSGTTGSPKGICVNHYAALNTFGKELATGDQVHIFLSYASMVWASSITSTLATATLGHIKVQASGFTPQKIWKHLEEYKVTALFIAPQDFLTLVNVGKPEGLKLPHLKVVCPVGGGLSTETISKARQLFSPSIIFIAYAQTELWSAVLIPTFDSIGKMQYINKPGSCGKPVKGSTYKIVDPDSGKILGPNQPGELCIKSKLNMKGYYEADSSHCFDEDGFLKTGDIMYYDEEYCFFFVERLKEMLRYKMTAIAPTELEGILNQHPSVKLAVVIGFPTDEGDIVTAVVVKEDNNVTAEELECLVASKVDERKKLRGGVHFVEKSEVPFTATGKIKRRALREYILKKRNSQLNGFHSVTI